jgi:hypothetical protein
MCQEKNKRETKRQETGTNTAIKANAGGGYRQNADGYACSFFYYVRISCPLQSVLVNNELMEGWAVPQCFYRKFLLLLLFVVLNIANIIIINTNLYRDNTNFNPKNLKSQII